LYSRIFLFLIKSRLLLLLNNGPPTNKSEKNARGVGSGGWLRSKEKGVLGGALKLAYLKWAVKKPATHPSS
jgi:hypothetical protein